MIRTCIFILVVAVSPSTVLAQSGIVTEPDSLLLRQSQDILVRNVTDDPVRIDSLQFSQHSFSGWTLAIGTIEDPLLWTPEGLYYAIGRLYLWQTFPEIELAPGDTALIQFGHLDRCIVCKAGGIREYVEIDTLFIYTDAGGADPQQVILNFEEFMVSIEDEPHVAHASIDIFPSPSSDLTTIAIRLENPASVAIRVFDILGRELTSPIMASSHSMHHEMRLNTSAWSPGVYLIRLETSTPGSRPTSLTRSMVVAR